MSETSIEKLIVKSSYAQLYWHILDGIENKKSIMIWGDPGVGKTSIIKHIAKLLGYHIEMIILSNKSQYDVAGMPINSGKDDIADNVVEYSMPSFLYNSRKVFKETKKHTVFVFDEINTADRFTLTPAYQFLQERSVNGDKFHENDIVIASGNYEDTGGLTERMPLPLANRVKHIYLEVTAEEWIRIYAAENNIHPLILSFLRSDKEENKRHFMNFDYEKLNSSQCKSFASTRSLESLSDNLYTYYRNKNGEATGCDYIDDVRKKVNDYVKERLYGELDYDSYIEMAYGGNYLMAMIQSHIGVEAGIDFYEWVRMGSMLPSPEDFFSGRIGEKETISIIGSEDDMIFIFANMICNYLKELEKKNENISDKLNKYIDFVKTNFSNSMFIYCIVVLVMCVYRVKFNHKEIKGIDYIFEMYKRLS